MSRETRAAALVWRLTLTWWINATKAKKKRQSNKQNRAHWELLHRKECCPMKGKSEQTLTKGSDTLSKLQQISCIKPQRSLLLYSMNLNYRIRLQKKTLVLIKQIELTAWSAHLKHFRSTSWTAGWLHLVPKRQELNMQLVSFLPN